MPDDFPIIPRGEEAFRQESDLAVDGRVVQMLSMATYAFGSREQVAGLVTEASDLGTPIVEPWPREAHSSELPLDQGALDALTIDVLRSSPLDNIPIRDTRRRLWREIERTRRVEPLLALLNVEQNLAAGLERVAAAAALTAVPNAAFGQSSAVLESALGDDDPRASELARVILGAPGPSFPDGSDRAPISTTEASSIAVHGTWARFAAERWYAPEGSLHQLIRSTSTPDLYPDDDYFRWTGGYSEPDRNQGAADLTSWLHHRRLAEVDTVFAHSHGGNVVLSAAASGAKIGLLVLMHTPALQRTQADWARIRSNVRRVVVMRTRLDYVLLGDGIRNGSTQAFDQRDLPHRQLMPHVLDRRGWISHTTFVTHPNWVEWNLPREVAYERHRPQ